MRNSRNLVHRDDDGRQELVGDGLHVLDGGLQPGSHLLVGHRLLWSHVIGQLAVDDMMEEKKKEEEIDEDDRWRKGGTISGVHDVCKPVASAVHSGVAITKTLCILKK